MKVVERHCIMVTVNEMQFSFMPENGTIDAVFISRKLQQDYYAKRKDVVHVFSCPEECF